MEVNGKVIDGIAVFLVLIFLAGASNALAPSGEITCSGCNNIDHPTIDLFIANVDANRDITLMGPPGHPSYSWRNEYGQEISTQKNLAVKITKDTQYALVISGNIVKNIKINAILPRKNQCLPDLAEIDMKNTYLAVGDKEPIKAYWSDYNNCANITFYWKIDPEIGSGLEIENRSSYDTFIKVVGMPEAGKNPVITAVLTNGFSRHEVTKTLIVGSNTAPAVKTIYTVPAQPLSFKNFEIKCSEYTTGKTSNEEGDYIAEFNVRIRSLTGDFDRNVTQTLGKDSEKILSVSVTPGKEGFYFLEARIKDSHGAFSEIFSENIYVGFGNTDQDAPDIKLKRPVEYKGFVYTFDTDATETHSEVPGLSILRKFEVRTVAGFEALYEKNGHVCVTPVCVTEFREPGRKEVKITMQYRRNGVVSGAKSEETVFVDVGDNGNIVQGNIQVTIAPTPLTAAKEARTSPAPEKTLASVPRKIVTDNDERAYSPGISIPSLIAVLFFAAIIRRIKQK